MCELNVPQADIDREDVIDMCQAIKEIREDGRQEGRQEGIISVIDTALSLGANLDVAIDNAANRMHEDRDKVVIIWNTYIESQNK